MIRAVPCLRCSTVSFTWRRDSCGILAAPQVRGGYETVAWLSGGFDAATAADFDTSNGKDMRHGAVGGLSGALGLSDVQREEAAMGRTVPGWVRAPQRAGACGRASDVAAFFLLLWQVTPAIVVALINWLSVTWLMQLKPPGTP